MKVVLNQDVKGTGKKGQTVEVSDGYARNFLLRKNLAVEATQQNINNAAAKEKAAQHKQAVQLAEAKAIIERDIQRLVEGGFISPLHPLRFRWRQRPDDRAQVRIAERQEGEDPVAMERLAGHRLMRLSGTDGRHQRMMMVIPEGQRDIGFIPQPGVRTVSTDHQTRGQHVAAL